MNSSRATPKPVSEVFNTFETAPLLHLIDQGALITQAKWEDRKDRISSCAPAAVLNAAMLAGALEPDQAHAIHDKMLQLPDLWIRTSHPEPSNREEIYGFRLHAGLQQARLSDGAGVDDVAYILMAERQSRKPFALTQLMYKHQEEVQSGTKARVCSGIQLVKGVITLTPVVSSYRKHTTTLVRAGDEFLEIDPRNPSQPDSIDIRFFSNTWSRRTGPRQNRRILEVIVKSL